MFGFFARLCQKTCRIYGKRMDKGSMNQSGGFSCLLSRGQTALHCTSSVDLMRELLKAKTDVSGKNHLPAWAQHVIFFHIRFFFLVGSWFSGCLAPGGQGPKRIWRFLEILWDVFL